MKIMVLNCWIMIIAGIILSTIGINEQLVIGKVDIRNPFVKTLGPIKITISGLLILTGIILLATGHC